jgi:hypothetical protein
MTPYIHQRQIFFITLKLPIGFKVSSETDFVLFNFIYFEIFLICFQILDFFNNFHYFHGNSFEMIEPVKIQLTNENSLVEDLQNQLKDSQGKLEQVNLELSINKIDHSKLIEVVESMTLKLSIYESLICEIRPQTTLRELRGKVKQEIPKLEHQIKGNQSNLEEISFVSTLSPLPISNSSSIENTKGDKPKRKNSNSSDTDSLHGDQSSMSMKIVGKRKGTEVQVIDVHEESDDETERDFNENDMNEMLSETNGTGEKKNKEVAFSEKILNSLTAGIKVSVSKSCFKLLIR